MAKPPDASIKFYQDALEANLQSLVFSRLADCYRKKGEIQQAIGICMQGLAIHPDYVTGRVILGRCYLEQEKLKEAIGEFVRVVELDRHNQVAIKMIADVYARQGMKEKAVDLYSCLLRMEPDNPSLAKLSQANRGNGETNVLRILGIESRSQTVETADSGQTQSSEAIIDADKTMQMDIVSMQPEGRLNDTAELGEMLIKTQKFDTEELNTAADAAGYHVEETISDLESKQESSITGDDISSRMTMIFGEEEAGKSEAMPLEDAGPAEAMDVVADNSEELSVREDTVAADSLDSKERTAVPVVSGSDVTSRIEMLFGDEQPSAASTAEEAVPIEPPTIGISQPIDEQPQSTDLTPAAEFPSEPLIAAEKPKTEESGEISGEDVTDRINEMFSDISSITGSLAEIGKMLDLQQPPIDEPEVAAAVEKPEGLPAERIDMFADRKPIEPIDEKESSFESPAAISGDDVAMRLDTIFEDNENKGAVTDALVNDVEEKAEPVQARVASPVDIGDNSIVIGGDLSDTDIHEAGEATLLGSETMASEMESQESPATPPPVETPRVPEFSIDDAMPQEAEPEMSGDDVVGRLDQLFSGDLTKDGGLDSIPEGDKTDEEINQGFYTMSGENAQTADTEDGLLSELDKQDDAAVKEEEIMAGSEGDNTVVMDRDGGEMTLAVTDEETILSDNRGQPFAQPASSIGGDVAIDGATQISLPPSEEPSQAESESGEYSIPDHVLTPTLADIYFQQGQPKLALQIYHRLLAADPDNDRVSARIEEIEKVIATQETAETAMVDGTKKTVVLSGPQTGGESEAAAQGRKKAPGAAKPLSGVRIKKVYKNRIRKSR